MRGHHWDFLCWCPIFHSNLCSSFGNQWGTQFSKKKKLQWLYMDDLMPREYFQKWPPGDVPYLSLLHDGHGRVMPQTCGMREQQCTDNNYCKGNDSACGMLYEKTHRSESVTRYWPNIRPRRKLYTNLTIKRPKNTTSWTKLCICNSHNYKTQYISRMQYVF